MRKSYIAAGTGGSVYFFEALDTAGGAVECREIKEPPAESMNIGNQGSSGAGAKDGKVTVDGLGVGAAAKKQWPGMLFGFGFLGSGLVLAGYIATIKWDLWTRLKHMIKNKDWSDGGIGEVPQGKLELNKMAVAVIGVVGLIFLILTVIAGVMNVRNRSEQADVNGGVQETGSVETDNTLQGGCGDHLCEPGKGETKANCPADCME